MLTGREAEQGQIDRLLDQDGSQSDAGLQARTPARSRFGLVRRRASGPGQAVCRTGRGSGPQRGSGRPPAPRPGLGRLAGRGEQLTPQELQIALLVTEGRTNAEAGRAVFLSTRTVEFHLSRAYRKLGVSSRTELTRRLAVAGTVAG
jgi:DNA-binding CsgD family transcriptional regulator